MKKMLLGFRINQKVVRGFVFPFIQPLLVQQTEVLQPTIPMFLANNLFV